MFGIFESTESKAKRLNREYFALAERFSLLNGTAQYAAMIGLGKTIQDMIDSGQGDPVVVTGGKAGRLARSLRAASAEFSSPLTQMCMQLLAVVLDAGSCDHPIANGIRNTASHLFFDARAEYLRSKSEPQP